MPFQKVYRKKHLYLILKLKLHRMFYYLLTHLHQFQQEYYIKLVHLYDSDVEYDDPSALYKTYETPIRHDELSLKKASEKEAMRLSSTMPIKTGVEDTLDIPDIYTE